MIGDFFLFYHFKYTMPLLLAWRVFVEKLANSLMGVPLYVMYCFSLVAFNILSLSLVFIILITLCLNMFLCGWDFLCFQYLGNYFLPQVREVSSCYLFKYFLRPFLFSFWDTYNVNISVLVVVLEVS